MGQWCTTSCATVESTVLPPVITVPVAPFSQETDAEQRDTVVHMNSDTGVEEPPTEEELS